MIVVFAAGACIGAPAATFAQGVQQVEAIASSDVLSQISMYSYREGRKSDLFFRGTPIAANAEGKAQVEYQDGNARIEAEVENLPEPASLGPYTTYVLWALTPDGRATNQGVIGRDSGGKGTMDTRYGASQFALIVTAEPHFAVTMPSKMIVLYNVTDDVQAAESKVTTLTERADYAMLTGIAIDDETNPLELVQARYAVAIARAAGADRFASAAYAMANQKLAAAETALRGDRSERATAPGLAREAVIAGEDARRSAMIASGASAAEAEQRAATKAATKAATETANDSARAAATEAARESAAAATAAATEAATAATEAASESAAAATALATEAATAATEAAIAGVAATEAATQAERERSAVEARADLRNQLNAALPTRESDRGLISEIGGVQFATGTAATNASARESLAKFSGIVASYPDLQFNVEGHTDSVGSVATNNELSLRRAMTVRDYLIGQGVAASSIDVSGLGLSKPIGDNSTADGRARNRRVEIVISGGPLAAR
jgi:outer membrane protein OmpA-like peptidoglycan-associated protein